MSDTRGKHDDTVSPRLTAAASRMTELVHPPIYPPYIDP